MLQLKHNPPPPLNFEPIVLGNHTSGDNKISHLTPPPDISERWRGSPSTTTAAKRPQPHREMIKDYYWKTTIHQFVSNFKGVKYIDTYDNTVCT